MVNGMDMLKKIKLALLASGVMLSSYAAHAVEEEGEKKSVQPIKPFSETQKTVFSGARSIGSNKARLLRMHKFPDTKVSLTQESLKEVSEKSST